MRLEPRVVARWVVTGELVLETAAHLGGEPDGTWVDMPLLRDPTDGRPLLTGATLAGALRSALTDRLCGYGRPEDDAPLVAKLFGHPRAAEDGGQSALIVFDSLGPEGAHVEIRDGVALEPATGAAADHGKYDLEVLPPGTRFPLRFELVVQDREEEGDLVAALAAALSVLSEGELALGARRSRGFGRCRAGAWRARRFDLTHREGWLAWLATSHEEPIPNTWPHHDLVQDALAAAWGQRVPELPDRRRRLVAILYLEVEGGLLIRSPGTTPDAADAVHLQTGARPVLPGTSLAGALRARATRIARLVRRDPAEADRWVARLFGPRQRTQPLWASRLLVGESYLEGGTYLRAGRIRIDRFTGGVMDGYLFEEEPHYRGRTVVRLELRNPREEEAGLLLLVLKDLLLGDLPLGGAVGVGRGRLRGWAEVSLPGEPPIRLDPATPPPPEVRRRLEALVEAFHRAPALREEELSPWAGCTV